MVKYPEQDIVYEEDGETIEIGRAINSLSHMRIGFRYNNVFQHIFVTGSTGSGKTYTVSRIVERAREKDPSLKIIIIDWHDEYRRLIKQYRFISPYKYPIPVFDQDDIYSSIELLSDALDLTNSQTYILEKVIKNNRVDSLERLTNIMEKYIDDSGWVRESRLALLRRLSPLTRDKYIKLFRSDELVYDLLEEPNIYLLNVSEIMDHRVRKIYVALLLKKIFMNTLRFRKKNKLLIVLEEAHNLVGRDKPVYILSSMLAEVRKFNIGLIIVSQSPSRLLEDVMINTNTKIIHSIKSSIDLEIINKVLYLPYEYQKIIPYLEVGEAILYTRGLKKPVIVKIE